MAGGGEHLLKMHIPGLNPKPTKSELLREGLGVRIYDKLPTVILMHKKVYEPCVNHLVSAKQLAIDLLAST